MSEPSFLQRLFKKKEQKVEPAAPPTAEELKKLDGDKLKLVIGEGDDEMDTGPMQRVESTPSLTVVNEADMPTEPLFTAEDMEFFAQGDAGTYDVPEVQAMPEDTPKGVVNMINRAYGGLHDRINKLFSNKDGSVNERRVHGTSFGFGVVGAMVMTAMLSHQMEGFQQNVESYLSSLPTMQMQVEK